MWRVFNVFGLCVEFSIIKNLVDYSIFQCFLGSEDFIPVCVFANLFGTASGVPGEGLLHKGAHALDFGGLNFQIGHLASGAFGGGLVDEHAGVRQGSAFAGGPCGQEDGGCGGGLT